MKEEKAISMPVGFLPEKLSFKSAPALTAERIRALKRKETAKEFMLPLEPGMHQYGFSKGQFSLIDVIDTLTETLPGGDLDISTWTAAKADLGRLEEIFTSDKVKRLRMLLDFSFQRRQPSLIHSIRKRYGLDALRITRNHAKFLAYKKDEWRIVVRTSMNLNFNPRLEDVDICDNAPLYDFLDDILNQIWKRHDPKEQMRQKVKDLGLDFSSFELE